MMGKYLISIFIILHILILPIRAQYTKGVPAGTIITNKAEVEWDGGGPLTDIVTTNVLAIYGMSEITGATEGYIFPGGYVDFTYSITNNSNVTNLTIIITLSNFTMTNGYSGSAWRATLLNITSQTIVGTNDAPIILTNVLSYAEVFSFILRIETAPDSAPGDWGKVPLSINITGGDTNFYVKYQGDNSKWYGGTNMHSLYPKVTIKGPFVALKKVLSISNLPQYLAMGGDPAVPVPDAVITYTNYYDNDGNAVATNLIIIDTIPKHTDFIVGSINIIPYTNLSGLPASYTIDFYNRNTGVWGYTPVATGPFGVDPNVGRIRIIFTGFSIGTNNGDNSGIADGNFPDIDAGYMWYKVVVHRRE